MNLESSLSYTVSKLIDLHLPITHPITCPLNKKKHPILIASDIL